jgi:hypothetical protein
LDLHIHMIEARKSLMTFKTSRFQVEDH